MTELVVASLACGVLGMFIGAAKGMQNAGLLLGLLLGPLGLLILVLWRPKNPRPQREKQPLPEGHLKVLAGLTGVVAVVMLVSLLLER